LVVGHNPGIEELISELTGIWQRMPTAALAEVHVKIDRWADLADDEEGELANLWLPRELTG
jgi:phosphohistidine phosphatase SixA